MKTKTVTLNERQSEVFLTLLKSESFRLKVIKDTLNEGDWYAEWLARNISEYEEIAEVINAALHESGTTEQPVSQGEYLNNACNFVFDSVVKSQRC